VDEIKCDDVFTGKHAIPPYCSSLTWSEDGNTLFCGYTDNKIRCYTIRGGY